MLHFSYSNLSYEVAAASPTVDVAYCVSSGNSVLLGVSE